MKLQSINPHDQSIIGEVEVTTPEEILQIVQKAKQAFPSWKATPIEKRIEYLKIFRAKILEHKVEFAELVSREMGKPINQSEDDVTSELGFIDYYVGDGAKALVDEVVLNQEKDNFRAVYEPYGVCAVIAPWNFPFSMFDSGVLPALVAGNVVVFKPSEYTTLSQKLLADLLLETGLPDGVFNLVIGGKDTGKALVDAQIDLVWFTGSTKAGLDIYRKAGEKFIKAICELGGSSAGVVFADANMEVALEQLYWARFLNTGQVCSAVKRLFIEKSAYSKFLEQYLAKLSTVKIGDPLDKASDLGPLVFPEQVVKLEEIIADAVAKGAKIEFGGKRVANTKGNYFEPTILTSVTEDMRVMKEEVFGPVLPIAIFETEEQAIEMANKSEYGLSAEIYTSDLARAERIAKRLEAGVVAVNTDNYYKPMCPIGGYKKSGIGREYGKAGMQEFAQIKLIAINKP